MKRRLLVTCKSSLERYLNVTVHHTEGSIKKIKRTGKECGKDKMHYSKPYRHQELTSDAEIYFAINF